jgi:hypothetical protein
MENPLCKYGKSDRYKWKIGSVEMKNQLGKMENPLSRNGKSA